MFGNYTGSPYISNMSYSPMMNGMVRSTPMMGMRSAPIMGMGSPMIGAPRTGGFLSSLFGGRGTTGGLTKSFNFGNLLNGASKALGVVKEAIPIVKEVGPMMGNMKQMMKIASIFKDETDTNVNKRNNTNTNTSLEKDTTKKQTTEIKEKDTSITSTSTNIIQKNEPNFFL